MTGGICFEFVYVKPNSPTFVPFQTIGLFLHSVVCDDQQLWVIAEALDAIFDVFAEDHTDPVLHEIDLVAKLQAVAPTLKTKVSQKSNVVLPLIFMRQK